MKLSEKFLELSETLVRLEKTRPRQASLRRAVSTSYYACLFTEDEAIRASLSRTVSHDQIDTAARDFSRSTPNLPEALKAHGIVPSQNLIDVAVAFGILQYERHDADYDANQSYTRGEVNRIVQIARKAFADWEVARKTPEAKLFLACFQLKKAWDLKR